MSALIFQQTTNKQKNRHIVPSCYKKRNDQEMAVLAMKMLTLFGGEVVFMSCPTPTAVAHIYIKNTQCQIPLNCLCAEFFSESVFTCLSFQCAVGGGH